MSIDHLVLGPPTHGVTRHGVALAGPRRTPMPDVGPDAQALARYLASVDSDVHVHLTDHLLGDDDATVLRAVQLVADSPRAVHVTLHDVPQPAEGEARFRRRRDVYTRLVEAAASVQVCSESERDMLVGLLPEDVRRATPTIGVVPLPVDVAADAATTRPDIEGPVGVLGFVHPGKNPQLAVDVAAATGRDVVFLGQVVAGHEAFVDAVDTDARARGVDVTVTGFLSEDALDQAIARVALPLAPYRHVSASGSIGRWIAAGRRPLAVATPWVRELAGRAPWAVQAIEEEHLVTAAQETLARPDATTTGGRSDGLVSTAEAARLQAAFLERVSHA